MKPLLTIPLLLLCLSGWGQKEPKYISISFNVVDWKDEPVKQANVYIETDDRRENTLKGKYKFDDRIHYNEKKNETNSTLKIPYSRFNGRSVSVRVHRVFNSTHDDFFKLDSILLNEGQHFDVKINRDTAAHNNERIVRAIIRVPDDFPEAEKINEFFTKQDLKMPRNCEMIMTYVSFNIDSTGKILNPEIFRSGGKCSDNFALKVVKIMPPMKEYAAKDGATTETLILPIKYKLQ